jgi:hypothetical protein
VITPRRDGGRFALARAALARAGRFATCFFFADRFAAGFRRAGLRADDFFADFFVTFRLAIGSSSRDG